MYIKQFFLSLLIASLLFATSCSNDNSVKNSSEHQHINNAYKKDLFQVSLKYAKGFSVTYFDKYQRLNVYNPWKSGSNIGTYILVQKEDSVNIELKKGEILLRLPLDRIAIMSVSNVGYFDLLKQLNRIAAVADEKRLYNKYLREGIALGSVQVLGNSASVNIEQLLVSKCDIFLQTAYESGSGKDQALIDGGVKVVYNTDWMEKTPLARAEWVKFMGLLTNQNHRADSIFSMIENNYIQLKQLADTLDYKPDVLVGGLYKDVWYMPGGKSFKAHLLADAGTNYHWAHDSTEGSLALSFEIVVDQQLNAPVWIEVPFKNKKELLISDERYAYFDAFKVGTMFNNLKRTNATGGNDYWEMGLCRPDEILADLIRIFHFEEMEYDELKYYEKVSE